MKTYGQDATRRSRATRRERLVLLVINFELLLQLRPIEAGAGKVRKGKGRCRAGRGEAAY